MEHREELILQVEALKKEIRLEKDAASGLKKLCGELEAQVASHALLDKQLKDLCDHRTGAVQKLEAELSQTKEWLAAEKEKVADMGVENKRMQCEMASVQENNASSQNELRELRQEMAQERGGSAYYLQEVKRLSEENANCKGSFEGEQKLREELDTEKRNRRALERKCVELQELGRHRETIVKQFESSFENMQKSVRLSEDELAFHRKELEITKADLVQEKQRSAQFEVALEEQRTLLVRLESAMEQSHVDLTRVRLELQQAQWDLKCESENAHRHVEVGKVREENGPLLEKARLEAEKATAKLEAQMERQAELERLCDELEMQVVAKTDAEAQLMRVKEQQDDLLKRLESNLEEAHASAMEERMASVTKQTSLLNVQRDLELKCEALESGGLQQSPVELAKIRTTLQQQEQECQALLELVMSSTQRLLGQEEPPVSVVNKNTFTLKFKEKVEEIEKMLNSNVEHGVFISEGEATLDQLRGAVDSMAKSIQTAGEMQASLVEQFSQTLCQLQAEKETTAALEGELEALGVQGRAKEALSSEPSKVSNERAAEVPKPAPGQQSKISSTPALQDSRRPSQQMLAPPSVKPTPAQSATSSVSIKSKAPSGSGAKTPAASGAKTPGRQSLMALLGPGKAVAKLAAVPAAKAAAPAKKVAVGKLPTKNA